MSNDASYRDPALVRKLTNALAHTAEGLGDRSIMHVCGTHEHEISRHALRQLLPPNIRLIAGPGCPVCITPASVIATAIAIAQHDDRPILCTYGDMVRVPIAGGSLFSIRGEGADVRVIYSIRDAVKLAKDNPERRVVFFSVGFETTAAPVAAMLHTGIPDNLLIYCCHRYVPTAVRILCELDPAAIDGFLLPGHASVITGTGPYEFLATEYQRASAIAGFEPADVLAAMLAIAKQLKTGVFEVTNSYPRAVRDSGNVRARELIKEVFEPFDGAWRGIGVLPGTGLRPREHYRAHDALAHYDMEEVPAEDIMPGCICHHVLMGRNEPSDCKLFGRACTPDNPQGPCMVSVEGTCRAHFLYPEASDV